MVLVTNNISGFVSNSSKIGIIGSVIVVNVKDDIFRILDVWLLA